MKTNSSTGFQNIDSASNSRIELIYEKGAPKGVSYAHHYNQGFVYFLLHFSTQFILWSG